MKSVTVNYLNDYTYAQLLTADGHAFIADEPPGAGGDGLGPDPYDLLLWGLGACTAMAILVYARRNGYQLSGVAVTAEHDRVHAEDCESCEDKDHAEGDKIELIRRKITLRGDLSAEQTERLSEIARRCPVQRTLAAAPKVIDTMTVES